MENSISTTDKSSGESSGSSESATGAGAGAGAGGLPDMRLLGGGGMPNLAEMMNNPQIMQAAQEMMSNPAAMQICLATQL